MIAIHREYEDERNSVTLERIMLNDELINILKQYSFVWEKFLFSSVCTSRLKIVFSFDRKNDELKADCKIFIYLLLLWLNNRCRSRPAFTSCGVGFQ